MTAGLPTYVRRMNKPYLNAVVGFVHQRNTHTERLMLRIQQHRDTALVQLPKE
jgi:hypothetical protein